jgi:type III pantothenate kinase
MNCEPDFLLVDVSNSYTKFVLSKRDRIVGRVRRAPTRGLGVKDFAGMGFETLVLSCVVPEVGRRLKGIFRGHRVIEVGPRIELGVGVEYPKPSSIGADRLANAAGASALFGKPCVVVDFGTAVTFDIVSAEGAYIGGVIAPGLEVMTDFLYARTALLPKISLREPERTVGKSTREAMVSGAVYGYRGLVRGILERVGDELGKTPPRVIATGGYAALIAEGLPEIETVVPNLTIEGLRIIGCLNSGRVKR